MVAATLSTGINSVLVGRIRDLVGNNYGRVHLPLRKDWKERLMNRKKQVWYPVCVESNNAGVNATKDAVQMSLKTREQSCPIAQFNVRGKFHVNICEAILTSGFESSNLMKLGKYGGANVRLSYTSTNNSTSAIRSRTRQSSDQSSSQHWRWENEWFVFTHADECQELHFSLQIGISIHTDLDGRVILTSMIEDASLRRLDLWLPLSDGSTNDDTTANAHLHVVVVYIPTIVGTLNMEFSESYTFSDSERILHVENTFYKCIFQDSSSNTAIVGEGNPMGGSGLKQLRVPLDTRIYTTAEIPQLVIQHIGVTKTLGEICLGVVSLDLLSVSDLCCLVPSSGETRERFSWCKFTDKNDRTKTTGVAKLQLSFDTTRNIAETQASTIKTLEERVASAEMFTIWKKLFYLLDQNRNGYIDRKEFTNVFVDHLEGISAYQVFLIVLTRRFVDMMVTSDGQKLMHLLFGVDKNQDSSISPAQEQITALFSVMDTNRDNVSYISSRKIYFL
ncbi:hypothetical protein JG688_00010160 [Phytophthora aleatoria]|uniref:EF-hand domain-containing protein n=1 Tax=Phytophthora aleatoria TaxID=2496075 RepID=A0A8J5M1W2_9STRA|nr:hypothetical protein JG688_00010160 [Phytophthora aleatoria]